MPDRSSRGPNSSDAPYLAEDQKTAICTAVDTTVKERPFRAAFRSKGMALCTIRET